MIFNVSSGGTPLNFRVVGGTAAPESPAENTIWVETQTPITSYLFSAEEPSPAAAGMVWIKTGTPSNVEFNALKKNGIQVYPLYAMQYEAGIWVEKTAKSYQGGAWVAWVTYLIRDSTVMTDITGGLVAEARGNQSGGTARKPSLSISNGSIKIGYDASGTMGGVVRTSKKIDLTGRKKIVFIGDCATSGWGHLTVWTEMGTYYQTNRAADIAVTDGKDVEFSLDVSSLDGSYYIGFFVYTSGGITPKQLYVG